MNYHKMKFKYYLGFAFLILFCFIYRFIFEAKSIPPEFFNIINETTNTAGYLVYIHTATFYTAFFVFILCRCIICAYNQILIRVSRRKVFVRNLIISLICSVLFSVCFLLPHLLYMCIKHDMTELRSINFLNLMLIQLLSYSLYYFITSNVLMLIYYLTLNRVLSQIITIGLNMTLMFGYRILHIKSPIETTLVFTKFYAGVSESQIIFQMLPLFPIFILIVAASYLVFSGKDVL